MTLAINNQVKIKRIKNQIMLLKEDLLNSKLDTHKGQILKGIERREKAIEFLDNSREKISFLELERKFKFSMFRRDTYGKRN